MGNVLKNVPSVRQTNARQDLEDFIRLANTKRSSWTSTPAQTTEGGAGRIDVRPQFVDVTRLYYDFMREDYSTQYLASPLGTKKID